jgi:aminopeptidase N
MLQKCICLSLLSFLYLLITAQTGGRLYNPGIDILHYDFNVQLTDESDSLQGDAIIQLQLKEKSSIIYLDLAGRKDNGKGMLVSKVLENKEPVEFQQQNDRLNITLKTSAVPGEIRSFEILYSGIPEDGLIISKNKYGHRTFFGDNWPNRAHFWLPCKDHLSDKASVDFIVTAPDHYQVVSNGIKIEETELNNHFRLTHWKETIDLPTKVMVIGLADFAVNYPGEANGIPLSSWVYPEEKDKGFYDYALAGEILSYYNKRIGPFAYKKLANVQSKTIFGGMENASAIFYDENTITGTRSNESLLAHEIAHQWFGDAATETDWPHLWLSEGFATEMTHLYLEHKYGRDTLVHGLKTDRKAVLAFSKKSKKPVVDTTESKHLMALLNTNSYQKGGWVLQMLREELGDTLFWKSIRVYYERFNGKNAATTDLQQIFEEVSGKNLEQFFTQWLYTAENPSLQISWQYRLASGNLEVTVQQLNENLFRIPLELSITNSDGSKILQRINISQKTTLYTIPVKLKPLRIEADPDCRLLFEGSIKETAE